MSSDAVGRQARLEQAIAQFLEAVDAGAPPDRIAYLNAHPEMVDELREFLAGHDQIRQAVSPDQPVAAQADPITRADAADQATLPLTTGGQPLLPPRVGYFGDYELLAEIARGGMGVVYRARQINLDRVVALKMILAGLLASADEVRRFRQEAEAAANLDHPGIVPIYEIGQHEGQHFFSMSYIDGPSLAEVVADGPLPPQTAAALVRQIAEAIAYAHSRGVLHRDLKPANVLLAPLDGQSTTRDRRAVTLTATAQHPHRAESYQPKLTDFGLAKRTQVDSGLTNTGQILGTPSYMPPEQAAGQTQQIGAAADVYSMGAILYCLLTGRPPFQAVTVMDTLLQVLEQEPVSPRDLDRQVPKDLSTIVLKCLRKDPQKRYASAQALADDLDRWLSGIPIVARPVGPVERATKWIRRHPATSVLLTAVAASLLVGTAVSWRFAVLAQQRARQAEQSTAETRLERDRYRDQLWQSMLQQGRAERLAGRRWESLHALGQAAAIKQTPELRRQAIQTITSAGVRLLHELPFGSVDNIAISSDGKRLAACGRYRAQAEDWNGFGTVVWEIPSGRKIASTETVGYGWPSDPVFRFQPQSHQILLSRKDDVALWTPTPQHEPQQIGRAASSESPTRDPAEATFSTDGKWIAVGGDRHLLVLHASNGDELARHDRAKPLAFLSEQVLLIQQQGQLHRWNFVTGQQESALPEGKELLDYTADGQIAVVADRLGTHIWNLVSGTELAALPAAHHPLKNAQISSDGRQVALQTQADRDVLHIWHWSTNTFKSRLTGMIGIYGDAFEEAAFDPQGSLLAAQSGNNSVKIWNIETGEILASLSGASAPMWTSDGRRLATIASGTVASYSSNDALVKLWQVTLPTRAYAKGLSGVVESVAFNNSGSQLVTDGALWDVADVADGLVLQLTTQPFGGSFDGAGNVWKVRQGQPVKSKTGIPYQTITIATTSPGISEIQFAIPGTRIQHAVSPDGKSFALASDAYRWAGTAKHPGYVFALELRELPANRLRWRHEEQDNTTPFTCLSFSPDGRRLATGRLNVGIELWEASTGEKLYDASFGAADIPGTSDSPSCVLFSGDGSRLFASNDSRGDIMMVDVSGGRRLTSWAGHSGGTLALAVHPKGTLLASAGADRMIRLWSMSSEQELASWTAHEDRVTALAFHPDGDSLVSGGADATLKIWSLSLIQKGLAAMDLHW